MTIDEINKDLYISLQKEVINIANLIDYEYSIFEIMKSFTEYCTSLSDYKKSDIFDKYTKFLYSKPSNEMLCIFLSCDEGYHNMMYFKLFFTYIKNIDGKRNFFMMENVVAYLRECKGYHTPEKFQNVLNFLKDENKKNPNVWNINMYWLLCTDIKEYQDPVYYDILLGCVEDVDECKKNLKSIPSYSEVMEKSNES